MGELEGDQIIKRGYLSRNIQMEISLAEASTMFPGFRFSPTDEELIQYYLKKKLQGSDDGVGVITEVDICRNEPWDLPAQSVIHSDNEWFFFSPRGRKYPNGSQSKRATDSGYWKATGKERRVKSGSNVIGTKRTLVFHTGRAPKGQRTEWIMHEYCASEKSQDGMVVCRLKRNSDFHLNSENPGQNTPNERDLSAVDNNITAICDGELDGLLDVGKVADGCSKECSSSYNSHSVEQIDGGYESDGKLTDGLSQHDSSSIKKFQSHNEEDDCYADIMKDDIIKLDDSSLVAIEGSFPLAVTKTETEVKYEQTDPISLVPFQGTANRRLGLRRQRQKSYLAEQLEMFKFDEVNIPIKRSTKLHANESFSRYLLLVLLTLLVLLLVFLFKGDYLLNNKVRDASKLCRLFDINWCGYLPSNFRSS